MFHPPPSGEVTSAFGLKGDPIQTHTSRVWRAGGAALKRVDDLTATEWFSDLLLSSGDGGEGFRIPRPLRTKAGEWTADGWCASEWVAGSEDAQRWTEILRAGDAFHRWLEGVSRPAWMLDADDPWRSSDRVAWGEMEADASPPFSGLINDGLLLRRPISAGCQLMHGDLTGNVLFDEGGGSPWIIDISLYWRPPGYASAIVAVDCYEWEGIEVEVLDAVATLPDGPQLLLRAELFRLVRAAMVLWDNPTARLQVHQRTLAAIQSRFL